MQIMLEGGLLTATIIFVLFGFLWIHEVRRRYHEKLTTGTWFNAAGFGFFPGMAAWKIFEPYCGLEIDGKKLFEPFSQIPYLTREDCFAPDRIELIAVLIAFVAVIVWLMFRKQKLPGNGDLFLSVICVWAAIRTTTESLRAFSVRYEGISIMMIAAVAVEMIVMAIWTVRRGRNHKNAAMTILEWLAITACGVISILQDAGVLSMGSSIANLAVAAGCSILIAALILSAGKDSREA